MYTTVCGAETKDQFLEGLKNSKAVTCGKPATPKTMAHNLYGIAYQYYKSAFRLDSHVHKDVLFRFIDRALTTAEKPPQRRLLTRIQDFLISRRPGAGFLNDHNQDILSLIQEKGKNFLDQNAGLRKLLRNPAMAGEQKEEIWFQFVNQVSEQIMRNLADTSLNSLSKARLFNIFQTMGSAGSVYFLLAPYFMTYRLFSRDRQFAGQCHQGTLGTMPAFCGQKENVAFFTDTFYDTNGVALTLAMQLEAARKYQKSLNIITCSPRKQPQSGVANFEPIGFYEIPEYPELKLYYPPFLKMLDYCFENQITHIHASTPGPLGWAAVAVARIMAIPVYGTYHTALPQYARQLTGDEAMGEIMWKAMVCYYNQLDRVYVPSRATGRELALRGVHKDLICYYSRGIDINRFHPRHRNGLWTDKYSLDPKSFKLLYVGRISREKNLDVLVRAFVYLEAAGLNIDLIIVGNGPYRAHMQAQLDGSRALFTGELTGDLLSQAFASSDLFVFPSSTDTFGNVILEAQASGLPVIVTDLGGPRENLIDGKTGRIVPAMDAQAIAAEVQDLYEHPETLAQMQKEARLYMNDRDFEHHFLESWRQEFENNSSQATQPGPDGKPPAQWPLAS
jgi:glycosyltransferase involved in cell wall biosynthesis